MKNVFGKFALVSALVLGTLGAATSVQAGGIEYFDQIANTEGNTAAVAAAELRKKGSRGTTHILRYEDGGFETLGASNVGDGKSRRYQVHPDSTFGARYFWKKYQDGSEGGNGC